MANWTKINNISDLQPGDIIEVPSKVPNNARIFPGFIVPFVKHYAMIVFVKDEQGNDKLSVVHNTFLGQPHIDPIEAITEERPINRILRTNIPNATVLERYNKCKENKYAIFGFNCESFVRSICNCNIGTDQRIGWGAGLGIILLLIILYLIFRK